MPWGPEDWDALIRDDEPAMHRPGAPSEALARLFLSIPDRSSKTAADLGCGLGAMLPMLAANFKHVIAVDYAPASLARARRHADGLDVEFRRRDLRDLKPLRGRLDVAVAFDSVLGPRSSDIDGVFEQVFRSLVEGGLFAATFPAVSRKAGPYALSLGEQDDVRAVHRFHEIEVQYRLRRAGFQGVRIQRFPAGPEHPESLLAVSTRRANN